MPCFARGRRRAIDTIDGALGTLARWFLVAANVCLVLMLAGTAVTIVLRPFDVSYYWIWPWVPAKLMLVPMLLPITDSFGIDRVHFGIILQLALLIGIATPPMGIGLYIMVEVGKVPFERVAVAVLPFLIPLMVVLVMITYMPSLTLWLPDLVLGPE